MTQLIDGKAIAKEIEATIKSLLSDWQGPKPLIVALEVGHDEASASYVRRQGKKARLLGLEHRLDTLDAESSFEDLAAHMDALAKDPAVTGIMLQMPLPKHLDEGACRRLIPAAKDVEAITETAAGRVLYGDFDVAPCTAMAALRCLEEACENGRVEGLNVAVVGRSAIVGKPLAMLLVKANATVTICHTRTKNLAATLRRADVVIAAAGRAGLITQDMVGDGAIVIDVGTNYVDGKLCGDVAYAEVVDSCAAITPVPGGVGPVTVAILMRNALALAQAQALGAGQA